MTLTRPWAYLHITTTSLTILAFKGFSQALLRPYPGLQTWEDLKWATHINSIIMQKSEL